MEASFDRKKLIWPVALAALIVTASSFSHVPTPGFRGSDKLVHFCVYALLATLICRVGRTWRSAVVAVLIVSAFGVTDELHQRFVPGRSPEIADWLADTLGATCAVLLYAGSAAYRQMLEYRPRFLSHGSANERGSR
jgi:VanZ family protein